MNWEAVAGAGVALSSAVLGWALYRQARKVDKVSEQSGLATETRAGTAQIIDGLNKLLDNVQEDNRDLRDALKLCGDRLVVSDLEHAKCRAALRQAYRQLGLNDDGNPLT